MKKTLSIFQFFLTLILLCSVLYIFDLEQIIFHIKDFNLSFLFLFLCLSFFNIFLVCIRFSIILKFLKYEYNFIDIVKNIFLGSFINQTPLTILGGDISRIISLKNTGINLNSGFIAVSIDRLLGLFSLILLVTICLYGIFKILDNIILFNMIVFATSLGWGGLFFLIFFKKMNINIKKIDLINQLSISLINIFKSLILYKILVLSILLNFITIVTIYYICYSMKIDISLLNCLLIVPVTMYFSLLPISIGGWGVREGMFAIALGSLSVPAEKSIAVSIIFGCVSLIVTLPGAFMLGNLLMNKKI